MAGIDSRFRHTSVAAPSQVHVVHSPPESPSILLSSGENETATAVEDRVPEGGHGWGVVSAAAILIWWSVGGSYTWGVMQAALVASQGYSPSTLAFVGSLTPACISIFAVPTAKLLQLVGTKPVSIAGIACLGLGSILSGFSVDNIAGLFFTWGLLGGIGTCFCFMTATTVPAQYFQAKRGIANGVVFAGGGLGGTVMSLVLDVLLRRVGIAWTFRIFGFLVLATGIPAAFFVQERVPIQPRKYIDMDLVKEPRFAVIFLTGVVATFPLFVPAFFLPLYARSLNYSSSVGAAFVAAFNFSSAVGRICSGFACDRLGSLSTLFITQLLGSLSFLIVWPLSTSVGPLAVFVIINGIANGGFFSTMPTVVGNNFGSARVSTAMGMVVTGWVGGYLMGAPIAGYILTASGGENNGPDRFRPAIFYAGGMSVLATVLSAAVRLMVNRSLKKKA